MFVLRFDDEGYAIGLDRDGTPFTSRHMRTAREYARELSNEVDVPVLVCTWDVDAQKARPRIRIMPDGSATPPPGAKAGDERVGDCRASVDGPACFCPNCRAARRRR